METNMKTIAVILAGGTGSRFGGSGPKQFQKLAGLTIIEHTIKVFNDSNLIDEILIVVKDGYQDKIHEIVNNNNFIKVEKVLCGGKERSDSSLAAIKALESEKGSDEYKLLFHDAVRPFVDDIIIQNCIDALTHFNAVDVAIPTADTIIEINNDKITNIPERSGLRRGQTPQGFKLATIKKAYELALADEKFTVTDDCGVVFKYLPSEAIYVVPGSETNIKITHQQDIFLADKLFQLRSIKENICKTESYYKKYFYNKTVVVFGGSYGIGQEIVETAKQYGAHVFSFSRSENDTNIQNASSVSKALKLAYEETGQIDCVINTAAILTTKPLSHLTHKEVLDTININYLGVINIVKASEEYLMKSKGSVLLFASSSYTRGRANYALYSSSKAAVVNLTQAMAEEWSNKAIRINCINPERTDTPMRVANFGDEPKDTLLTPKVVAMKALSTLASEYTGQVIDVTR